MRIHTLLHASFVVENLDRARAFYEGTLGLTPDPTRPAMSVKGAWYRVGAQQIHLLNLPNPEAGLVRPEHGGQDRHVALAVDGLDTLRTRLEAAGIAYTLSRSGRAALFCRDPDGNALEFTEAPA